MANYVVDNCCFCVDLQVGCFIIGYVSLICSIVGTILLLIAVIAVSSVAYSNDATLGQPATLMMGLGIVALFITAALIAVSVILLIGLHKNKPTNVRNYLIYNCIYLVISVILIIVTVACTQIDFVIFFFGKIVPLFVDTYFLMVIRSYYYKMQQNEPAVTANF